MLGQVDAWDKESLQRIRYQALEATKNLNPDFWHIVNQQMLATNIFMEKGKIWELALQKQIRWYLGYYFG